MSFYSDASLTMIPSGYKDQKVYSVTPTDGSGDLTFSRASNATRVNSSGLVEKVRENLALYSQDFSNAAWSKNNITLTAGQTDPNGGSTAARIDATDGASAYIKQNFSITSGVKYTFSVYIKGSTTGQSIAIYTDGASNIYEAKSITTSWQRFTAVATAVSSGSSGFYILCGSGYSLTDLPFDIAFAQVEASDIATDYIATTSAAVSVGPVSGLPRLDYSGGASCPSLLLEPQRSNLITFSEQMDNAAWIEATSGGTISVTPNYATSPSGYQDAERIQMTYSGGSGQYAQIYQSFSVTAGASYTVSVYLKSLSGTPTILLGNYTGSENTPVTLTTEWQRYTLTVVASSSIYPKIALGFGFSSTSADILAWGYQIEAGAYATSYIPTLSSAVTRVADAASKTGISSLIGQTAGTIYWESKQVGGAQISLNTTNSVISDGLQIYASGDNLAIYIQQGGTTHLSTVIGAVTEGTNFKIALAYGTNFVMAYINGVQTYTTTATIPMPTMTMLNLAFYGGGPTVAKSENKQVLLFNSILTPSELATLTA